MEPEKVNPNNFKNIKVIHNEGGFSIATGIWQEDNTKRFAMRWNGNSSEDKGYPSIFKHSMWFQLPEDIEIILKIIIEHNNLKNEHK